MPIIQILKKTHLSYKFKSLTKFHEFKKKPLVPFCMAELPKIVTEYPIAFTKTNGVLGVSFMTGFTTDNNMYVNNAGEWLGKYVPALFRSMPFIFTTLKQDQTKVLSYIEEFGCVAPEKSCEDEIGFHNMYTNGEYSEPFEEMINFLRVYSANMQATYKICKDLDNAGFITEWPLKIKFNDAEKEVKGLYKINSEKLFETNEDEKKESFSLDRDMQQLAYGQIFSVNNLEKIASLYSGASIESAPPLKNKSWRDKVLEKQQEENSKELDQLVKNLITDE